MGNCFETYLRTVRWRIMEGFGSCLNFFKLIFCLSSCSVRPIKTERIFAEEIDRINDEKLKVAQCLEKAGQTDFLPNCDLSIWMRSLTEEVISPLKGETSGCFPAWLSGSLFRNGPGNRHYGKYTVNHLFDCSALLQRFCIRDGEVIYQCRFVKSEAYSKGQENERIVLTEFGTRAIPDPCKTIFQKFASFFVPIKMSDNTLVTLCPFKDQLYTFSDGQIIHRIDPDSLETLDSVNISKFVNIVQHSAHPHVSGKDGTVYNIGLNVGPLGPKYSIIHFPNSGPGKSVKSEDAFLEARVVGLIPSRWALHPSYMHTFGITASYFIIVEQPLSISVPAMVQLQFNDKPLTHMFKWFAEKPTLFHVMRRRDGKCVGTYFAEPFFYLHIINQYEDSEQIIIDICAYKDPSMMDCMLFESLKTAKQNPKFSSMFRGRPIRFALPLPTPGTWVSPQFICDMGCETPRINYPLYSGKHYRFFYAISSDVDLESPGTLIKVDVINRTKKTWSEPGTFPCEPIFVPSPDSVKEDDGVVLTVLLWSENAHRVALVVLDAAKFTEMSRTIFTVNTPVPKCLHGLFMPDTS